MFVTFVLIVTKINNWYLQLQGLRLKVNVQKLLCPSRRTSLTITTVLTGAQLGLVSSHAGDVAGEQWRRRWAERDQEPAGETRVHHETGLQPVRSADWTERAGMNETDMDRVGKIKQKQNTTSVWEFIHINSAAPVSWYTFYCAN